MIPPDSLRRPTINPSDLPEGSVLYDQRRSRTAWYEGQFVTAEDFNRDQSYLLTRQADLGQAIGKGVVEGLEVSADTASATSVIVSPGIGLGGAGETILVHQTARLDLAEIATQRNIGQQAGLIESLAAPLETRTGLFVLAATPVEYFSNPVGAYPTSIDGERRLEDSLVTEAVLFTLSPFPISGDNPLPDSWAAQAARRIFVEGGEPDLPAATLPLAMVALRGNVVLWIDGPMVQREAGAARADVEGLGQVDEARRIAHFRQYDTAVRSLIDTRPDRAFAAHEDFQALPPMGLMPAACIAPRVPAPGVDAVLSQNWLPSRMPVELVALPEDEIAALLDESLTLPPIDLQADAEALANTPVSVIVPVVRDDWATTPAEVQEAALKLAAPAPLGGAPTSPIELLRTLISGNEPPAPPNSAVDPAWLALLAGRSTLWYTRRRQLQRSDTLVGEASPYVASGIISIPPDESDSLPDTGLIDAFRDALDQITRERFTLIGLDQLDFMPRVADPATQIQLMETLNSAIARGGALVANGMLSELRTAGRRLSRAAALRVIKRYGSRTLGDGVRPVEPALYGADFRVSVLVQTGGPIDPKTLASLIAGMTGISRTAAQTLAAAPPVTVPVRDAVAPETARRVLELSLEAQVPVEFTVAAPASRETVRARDFVAGANLVPEVDRALARSDSLRRIELVGEIRTAFDSSGGDLRAFTKRLSSIV